MYLSVSCHAVLNTSERSVHVAPELCRNPKSAEKETRSEKTCDVRVHGECDCFFKMLSGVAKGVIYGEDSRIPERWENMR